MAAPTPYILVHCDAASLLITRVGLLSESGQPIMLNSCVARAVLSTDRLEDFYGDLYAQAWGNRKLFYDLEMDQFAQYGVSDSFLGRFDTTLLANLAVNFGMDAANSGTALLTQGSRELIPGKIAKVRLTVEVEDTRDASLGSPDGASSPAWGGSTANVKPSITGAPTITQTGTISTAFSYTVAATGTATITFALGPGHTLPTGLSLNTSSGAITGTPSGSPSEKWIEIRATNAYGTSSAILHLTIAAAAVAPADPVQAYVRYLVDSAQATVPDGFWAAAYSGAVSDPTNEATFLAGSPTSYDVKVTDPGVPSDPNSRTGGIASGTPFAVTGVAATNLLTATAHGLTAGDKLVFPTLTGGAGLTAGTNLYYVIASGLTADDFKVSTTAGGAEVNFTTDISAGTAAEVTRIWQITEILGRNPGTGEYEYWYQRDADEDTALSEALEADLDVVNTATEEYVLGEDIGTTGPGDPAAPAWPGTIEPSERVTQYYLYKDFLTGLTYCGGFGGDKVYPNLAVFMAEHTWMYLSYTETQTMILLEIYNNDGSPAYLYQRDPAEDTRIEDALGAGDSPIYHGADRPAGITTSLPEEVPAFTLLDLPTPPATNTGPAPAADSWLYVLAKLWGDGSLQCWGLRAHMPADANFWLERLIQVYKYTFVTSLAAHTETTYGHSMLMEVWSKTSGTWKAHWLDPTTIASAADSLIGRSLADDVSPINNPLVAPGVLYSALVDNW